MNFLKRYHSFILALIFVFLPLATLCIPAIFDYVVDTWHVAAFYSSIIIVLYLTGCFVVIFSFIEIAKCVSVLRKKNADKHSYLLGDANKIVFSPSHGLDDDTIASLYESMDNSVNRKQNQSLAGVMTCANLSTMIGLLGTFAGLSMTIASVITLLEKSQITGGNEADTLSIIVNVVSSLSEPLKGMNTAFVSSIYGVVSAILLNVVCSFLRGEFVRLSIDLRNARLDFVRECRGRKTPVAEKTKTLRVITDLDEVVKEFKDGMFAWQERLATAFNESNDSLKSLLANSAEASRNSAAFNERMESVARDQAENLQKIDRGISLSHATLGAIEQGIQQSHHALKEQREQLETIGLNQDALYSGQQKIHAQLAGQGEALGTVIAHQETLQETVQSAGENISHVEATVGEMSAEVACHFAAQSAEIKSVGDTVSGMEQAGAQRHVETIATIESQSQTFEPLLGQIAGMHRSLQKDINVIKGQENK
jgi:MotA/TolQ/ExbB proton channel family